MVMARADDSCPCGAHTRATEHFKSAARHNTHMNKFASGMGGVLGGSSGVASQPENSMR